MTRNDISLQQCTNEETHVKGLPDSSAIEQITLVNLHYTVFSALQMIGQYVKLGHVLSTGCSFYRVLQYGKYIAQEAFIRQEFKGTSTLFYDIRYLALQEEKITLNSRRSDALYEIKRSRQRAAMVRDKRKWTPCSLRLKNICLSQSISNTFCSLCSVVK